MSSLFEGALVPSISIENLLGQRDGIVKRVGDAIAMLEEAQEIANASGIADAVKYRGFDYMLHGKDHRRETLLAEKALETVRKRLDACAWNHLLVESGLRSLMDAKAREEWWKKIDAVQTPELTADNIRATFSNLYASRDDIFERGVLNCFKALSWCYKTNKPFRFGKRLVIRFLRNSMQGNWKGLGHPNSRQCDELDDLIRVLSVMDGKPEPDHRQGMYYQLSSDGRNERETETDYMSVRSFRNGNGHVTFKRLDLVEKMNQILAKHYPGALAYDRHVES